jgi:hypothetical protein
MDPIQERLMRMETDSPSARSYLTEEPMSRKEKMHFGIRDILHDEEITGNMEELALMEELMDYGVPEVCRAIINIAQDFSIKYGSRYEDQHASSVIGIAMALRDRSEGLRVEDLLEYPPLFKDLRYLLREILEPVELKPMGMRIDDPRIEPDEVRPYATADGFMGRVYLAVR